MSPRRLPHLLVLAVLTVGTPVALSACGGDSLTDVTPRSVPEIVPPDGQVDSSSGSGDQAGSIDDLPTATTST